MTPLLVAAYIAMPGIGVIAFCCWFLYREQNPGPLVDRRRAMAERVKK